MLIAVVIVCGLVIPWLGFASVLWISRVLSANLPSIRGSLDDLQSGSAGGKESAAIDDALTQLGFPKRDPKLAE